jgi:hypothetical protein
MSTKEPVPVELGDWSQYVFPEESFPEHGPVTVEIVSEQGWPGRASLRLLDENFNETTNRVLKRISKSGAMLSLPMSEQGSVRWTLFSPFQVFLEEVAAEKLRELEP